MKYIIPVLLSVLLFSACNSGVTKGDKIDAATRKEVEATAAKICAAIRNKDITYLKEASSSAYLKVVDFGYFDSMVSKVMLDNQAAPVVVNEYLMQHDINSKVDSITTNKKDGSEYKLVFPHVSNESFIYLGSVKGLHAGTSWLMTITLLKEKGIWKIQTFSIHPYQYAGKTAPELFALAQEEFRNHHIMSAQFRLLLASETAKAGGSNFHYLAEKQMKLFSDTLRKELVKQFPLPMKLDSLPTKPMITGISAKLRLSGIYPLVIYKSSENIDDAAALRKENTLVHQAIGNALSDIKDVSDSLVYIVIDEIPTPKVRPNKVEIVRGNKE
jgi:hypothetical protein